MTSPLAAGLFAMLLACAAQASQAVQVARARVELPGSEWVMLASQEQAGVTVESGRGIPLEEVSLALVHDRQVRAIVTIGATAGGAGGKVNWKSGCSAGSEALWAHAMRGGNPEDLECAYASAEFDGADAVDPGSTVAKALSRLALDLPSAMVSTSAVGGSRMGALMTLNVLAAADFVGLRETGALASVPATVNPQHAAYALRLGLIIRDCHASIRCRVELPALEFAPRAPAEKRVSLAVD